MSIFIKKKDSVPSTSISRAITATEIGRRRASRTIHIMAELPPYAVSALENFSEQEFRERRPACPSSRSASARAWTASARAWSRGLPAKAQTDRRGQRAAAARTSNPGGFLLAAGALDPDAAHLCSVTSSCSSHKGHRMPPLPQKERRRKTNHLPPRAAA